MTQHPFIPVILGTAINCYNVAISFHEEYGINPTVVGKLSLPFTEYSSIIGEIIINPKIHDKDIFVDLLNNLATRYKGQGKKLLLVGTEDVYVRLIIENRDKLDEIFVFNYIDELLMKRLYYKSNFYQICAEHGIDTPSTYYYPCTSNIAFKEPVSFPVIIKPSDGILYYKNSFKGQEKVYRVNSYEEVNHVIEKVKSSGYKGDLIIQDYIPGDDTYMWDAVYYGNSNGKGELITFAQVVLQEHTPTTIGNYTAVIPRYHEEMMLKLKNFLEAIGYVGYANFDLKYDERDGKFKALEVNIRQGRSSYYITPCGHNMAKYLVDDLIYGKTKPLTLLNEKFLFTVVPKCVLKRFVKNTDINSEVRSLIKSGHYGNPLFYKKDTNLKRKLYLFLTQMNYYRKYKNYNW